MSISPTLFYSLVHLFSSHTSGVVGYFLSSNLLFLSNLAVVRVGRTYWLKTFSLDITGKNLKSRLITLSYFFFVFFCLYELLFLRFFRKMFYFYQKFIEV